MESDSAAPPEPPPMVSRRRWWIHLALIGLYPVITVAIGYLLGGGGERHEAILPRSVSGLLYVAFFELSLFAIVFGLALVASRASAEQLMLRWRMENFPAIVPALLGVVYSVALRVIVAMVAFALLLGYLGYSRLAHGKQSPGDREKQIESITSKARPKTEALLDMKSLGDDPVYLALMLTVISFGVAGLREELWRAGVFAGIGALFPKWYSSVTGKLYAITLVAIVFGLCHLPQGWGGVGLTTLLGLGLGIIMVFHGSTWIAVLAHGFFDATTFAMIVVIAKYKPGILPGL